jgi:murein tripeptide amidase MpaA
MRALITALLVAVALAGARSADWYCYRVYAPDAKAIQKVVDCGLTLLSETVGYQTDVAAPNDWELRKIGLRYEPLYSISDPTIPYVRKTDGADYRTEYLRYDEIIAQYEGWRAQYPTLITRDQIGTSILGRPIWVYRLHNPNAVLPTRIAFIQGGIHAREWISPPVCMYFMDNMLREALSGGRGWELITRYEFNVVPVVNPDGYEYTWTDFRLWRKNRRNIVNSSEFGVDLNRNYSKAWGGQGSSGNPASETYRGTAPFSEPEVACIRDYLNARTTVMPAVIAIDYHSYAQKILYAWSYTEQPAPDDAELDRVGHVYRNGLLASGGLDYEVGQGSTNLYIASGVSKDFYYDSYDALAYTVEMRPTGNPGFELPPSQILPTARENWAGFRAVLRDLL